MKRKLPQGTYVPIITPFTKDKEIDFSGLDKVIDRLLAAEVEAVVILGTTGESATVDPKESVTLIKHVRDRVQNTASVVVGIGNNDTQSSIIQGKAALELGVDGLLVVCPYYTRPTQQGLFEHFSAIAEHVDIPQIIYNIEGRSGVNVETDTLARLAVLPNVIGVKESSDNIEQVSEVLRLLSNEFLVFSGCDHLNFSVLSLGGHGVISTIANVAPKQVKAMVDAALCNDFQTARHIHFEIAPVVAGCGLETNPLPVKTALALMGEINEIFRLPLCRMEPNNRAQWSTLLEQQGIL